MEQKYYAYYHIRHDLNHVFYVGVGTKEKKDIYKRSKVVSGRNPIWENIVSKTDYTVIILKDFDTKMESLIYEKRLIQLFGIIKEGGQLANICKDSTDSMELGRIAGLAARKPVYQYTMDGEFLAEYSWCGEAAEAVGGNRSNVYGAANGIDASHRGFQWRTFKTDKIEAKLPQRRKVYQYDLDGSFVKEWDCVTDASIGLNILNASICAAFPGGASTTAGNFQWRREKYDKLKPIVKHSPRDEFKKLIYQYDKNCNLINTFHGEMEAGRLSGIRRETIGKCCRKCKSHKTAGGFLWSYEPLTK